MTTIVRRGTKRQRTGSIVVQAKTKRPLDKNLICVAHDFSVAQRNTVLITATFPGTITGLRWSLTASNLSTNSTQIAWAITRYKQGIAVSNLALADGASFFGQESEVIAFGHCFLASTTLGGEYERAFEGETRSMRKLQGGDRIVLQAMSTSPITAQNLSGVVQFFNKS